MLKLSKHEKIIVYALLLIYSLVIIVPFLMMIMNSLKTMRGIFLRPFSMPSEFVFQNYVDAWNKAQIGTAYMNSALIASISVIGIIIISSMFAYAISRYKFPFRRQLFVYSLLGLALPSRLAVIPIYIFMRNLNLINSRIGLIIIYVSLGIPFSMFLLKIFIDAVPIEIEESARIDGANPWKIFWYIIIPLIKPAIAVVSIINFVNIWNDFFFPLIFINSKSKATVTLAVMMFQGEYISSWNLLFAGLTLAMAPMLILFLIFSKQFIGGMTQGAIK